MFFLTVTLAYLTLIFHQEIYHFFYPPDNKNIFPSMLTEGNWTCTSYLRTTQIVHRRSPMRERTAWWNNCDRNMTCLVKGSHLAESSDKTVSRFVTYSYERDVLVKSLVTRGSGLNNMPYHRFSSRDLTFKLLNYFLGRQYYTGKCLGQFTFRNLLDGSYLVESSDNLPMIEYLMTQIGGTYQIGVLDKCSSTSCLFLMQPINVSSFDLH